MCGYEPLALLVVVAVVVAVVVLRVAVVIGVVLAVLVVAMVIWNPARKTQPSTFNTRTHTTLYPMEFTIDTLTAGLRGAGS